MTRTYQPTTLLHPVTGRERTFLRPVARAAAKSPVPAADPKTPPGLARIIRPESAHRWMLPSLSAITPQYVENVLRGAIAGSHQQQWELFDLMEDTWPRLVKDLNELKRSVVALDWTCNAWAEDDEPPTPEAEERARLVSRALWTMRPDPTREESAFEASLYDILDAWAKGTSVLEVMWEHRPAGKLGQIVAPKSTAWVHPKHYGWSREGWIGLYQGKEAIIPFPEHKFLVAICKSRTGHPLSGALLRPLAWWWCAANFSADWLLNLAQVFGLPFRWANYDSNASQSTIDAICGMLENMGSAGWAAFPAGTTLELKEATKSGDASPQADLLDRADTQADLLILGQTLTSTPGKEGSGSYALGEVHSGVRLDVIIAAGNWAAGVINQQLVPAILALNYGDLDEPPEWTAAPIKQEDQKANAERDQILINAGMEIPKPWFHERHGVPIPQDGEEVVKRQAPPALPGSVPGGLTSFSDKEDNPAKAAALRARARTGATEQLIDRVLEDLTGVQAKWLGSVRPFFADLVVKAQDTSMSEADFIRALEGASRKLPELFEKLDHDALASALEAAMGAACANGALAGAMQRRKP